jgi:DNA polymerase (family 10)
MRNAEIAAALRELGTLYELDGADRFRVLAYKDAAKVAADSPVSLEQLSAEGRLTELPGFGKTLAVKVEALIETGSIPAADKLKDKFPATLVEVTRVPGLGAKKVRRLHDELGVTDLDSLRAAAEQEQIREMKGFGVKVEERVLAELDSLPEAGGDSERRLLSKVLPVAAELAGALGAFPGRAASPLRAPFGAGARPARTSTSSRPATSRRRWARRSPSTSWSQRPARRARRGPAC